VKCKVLFWLDWCTHPWESTNFLHGDQRWSISDQCCHNQHSRQRCKKDKKWKRKKDL